MATGKSNQRKASCGTRCKRQWILSSLVFLVIALGWWFPSLGFTVPITMVVGMVGGLRGGRWVCGNLCPRGSFWDRPFSWVVQREKSTPVWLKHLAFRWAIFAFMIGFMFYRVSADITNPLHWGRVFWLMCTVTTGIGIVGGLLYRRRFWCIFCPIGTFASTVSGHKRPLKIDDAQCVSCHLCDRACPIGILPEQYRHSGAIADRDCLRCQACIDVCPKGAISRP